MFQPVPGQVSFPRLEEEVLAFWRERRVYHRSLERRAGAEPFVFYEGPPTANGMPHPGHCLTRTIKDVFPRYKTMRGYRCERKAGWDTHGLPVEVEVCKELGIHSKEEIERYGVEPFIQKCQQSVWRYMKEWERLTERIGFWVDLDEAYVTYHQSYVESVWWSLAELFDRGLLYQGHKIVWWWAQGGTALSAGEVGQGYRQVADPSVYVKFPIVLNDFNRNRANEYGLDQDASLLVWTTTPWTLPSNQFVAVNQSLRYVTLESRDGERLVVAKDCVESLSQKMKAEFAIVAEFDGNVLLGFRYRPPFDCFEKLYGDPKSSQAEHDSILWIAIQATFVTTESGTGLVHVAPAFGEADYNALQDQARFDRELLGLPLFNCVGPDGKFTDEAPEFVRGRWVKDCDKDIVRNLKERGLLFHQEQYLHDYPFCWRAEQDPLIQYPRESWFIKTTAFKDAMLENNAAINWLPGHIQEGRFGKFLESNVDWALSRERYWGTPLPIWECEACSRQQAADSYDELLAKPGAAGFDVWEKAKAANPSLPDDLRVHKPYIDAITYDCPCKPGARMKRVTEVIDCWYDSGAMPFAQWGYKGMRSAEGGVRNPEPGGASPRSAAPSDAAARFAAQFPADFISEAIDQTRGWFYSQLAISTMLWSGQQAEGSGQEALASRGSPLASFPHPFRNCIVLGLMLGEDGQKMSKSKRNYRDPAEIFDLYGADALRWYLLANQPPWTSIRYSEQAIKDSIPEFLLRLWNCYSFFVIYANIDGFDPKGELPEPGGASPRSTACAQTLTADEFAHAESYRPLAERDELDRWVLGELERTVTLVTERMDAYDNFGAAAAITEFVDGLSNWYVRRCRDRFWAKDQRSADKLDAYWTLYECLVTTSKLIAPFTPFLADTMWRNLAGPFRQDGVVGDSAPESVHLADYPIADATRIDTQLSERMALVRLVASLGRNARSAADLKVRQPLAKVEVILAEPTHRAWLAEHAAVLEGELNVKRVEFAERADEYVAYQVLPNFKLLGKRLGKLLPGVKQALGSADGATLLAELRSSGKITLAIDGESVDLTDEEIEVRLTAKPGWAAASDRGVVVVLSTELTPELVGEGLARDLVRAIQDRRKELGCEFTDRIKVGVETDSAELRAAVEEFRDFIAGETLADKVGLSLVEQEKGAPCRIGDADALLSVVVA
ncbi:MAG: isoleucine--tRNA ligase [Lacipirellulaceae bacterium]